MKTSTTPRLKPNGFPSSKNMKNLFYNIGFKPPFKAANVYSSNLRNVVRHRFQVSQYSLLYIRFDFFFRFKNTIEFTLKDNNINCDFYNNIYFIGIYK